MRPWPLALAWLACSLLPAAAADLEELKRLARRDASAELQREAAEASRQAAIEQANKADKAANQQPARAPAGALSGSAAQMERLAKGIEAAHAAAPNRWYQAAKIEDITPPGDDQRKVYQISTLLGTYCVRYQDKNKVDQGRAYTGAPLIGACPHMF